MTDYLKYAVDQAKEIYRQKVGTGDLTTENLFPYPRYLEGKITVTDNFPGIVFPFIDTLLKTGDSSVSVHSHVKNGSINSKGDVIAVVEGNGRAILTGLHVAQVIVSLISQVHDRTRLAVKKMENSGIGILHSLNLPSGWERLIQFAVKCAGGETIGSSLDEIIYLSKDHFSWAGSIPKAINQTLEEVGEKRGLIKVVVEIDSPWQIKELVDIKIDYVYGKNFSVENVAEAYEITRRRMELIIDETIPIEEAKNLKGQGVRLYMVDVIKDIKNIELLSLEITS
tara:strand:+ start:1595 stop:2443 length:849 start_codon:yes stop_codon:yes gene_type:complete